MKKSFMTRVLAVTLSTAMAFSVSSAGNLMTASAATKPFVSLKTKFKTLTVGQKYKMTLKNNSIKWRIQKATSSDKTIVKPYIVKPTYVKLKGLKEGRVKVTYKLKTTKRKTNNTKTLKGTVQVKAKGGDTEDPGATFSATATAADTTSVKITFSQAIDTEGVTAENFTINNDVTVREAKVSEDGKTVDLTIAGATYDTEYEVTVKGVKVAGEAKDTTCKFKTPAAAAGYQPKLDVGDKPMKSDGQSTRVVKFELRDSAGELVEAEGVEVLFETTLGSFAEPRAVLDKGVAENTFTSQALNSTRTATITASVIAANNKDLIGQSVIGNIVLTPNPEQLTDTSIGAIITNVVAPTADRVVAYFQKDVEAKDFRKANGALDGSKFEATVWSNVDSGNNSNNPHKVVGILDVEGEPNALELLVDKPMIDNTTIKVEFKDKRTNSVIESSNTVYCKLTDGYQPSALKVNVKDNRTLEVEFSEAVLRGSDVEGTGNAQYAADSLLNYAIDAKKIENYGVKTTKVEDGDVEDSAVYRISYKDTTEDDGNKAGSIRVGTYSNAVDKRHIVTIKLGEGYALSSGDHSLAISNVGDWAASTDGWRNILNTATLNFHVPENTEAPKFDLEVMSPEQYKLTANCDFSVLSGKTFKTANSSTAKNEVVIKLQQYIGNDWVDISKDATTEDTVGDGRNPIMVSQIMDASGQPTREYLVETTKDWTKVHDTKSSHKSYYNNRYRLHIDAGQLKSLANDKTNDAINIELSNDPMMQRIDDTNLNITSIEQVQDKDGNLTKDYRVTFNKPIKMNDNANKEGMTPTQDVNAGTMYSAYFIKRDASQTSIPAKIATDSFVDAVDTILQVQPTEDLTAGEWDLYVRGVADDYGNTAPTLSGVITVDTKEVVSDFKVVWAAVSTSPSYEDITEGEGHYIFVKFNQPINVSGSTSTNVAATLNYQINGKSLPTGSNIISGIKGYDDDSDGVTDSITIELPQGNNSSLGGNTMNYPVNGSRAILTISNSVTNKNGAQLVTEPGYNLPYQYGEAPDFGLSKAGDAVWGNDDSEKYNTTTGYQSKDAYISAFKNALANEKYRKVKLDRDIPKAWLTSDEFLDLGTLNINRIVDLDLNGINILGNIKIDTKDQADELVIENSYSGKNVTVKGKSDAEKSATLTINTPNTDVTIEHDITFDKGNSSIAWQINGVPSETLFNYATVKGNIALAGNGIGFRNMGSLAESKIVVDTTGTVYFKGDFSEAEIVLEKKVTLNLEELSKNVKNVIVKAAASTVKVLDKTKGVTITAEAKDVLVQTDALNQLTLKADGEGSFKQQLLNGDTPSNPVTVEATGAQNWINSLKVISGSVPGETLVEIITASSASGSSIDFTHKVGNEEKTNLVEALKTETKTETEGTKSVTYAITGVNISTSGSNLTYDSATGSVKCSTANSSNSDTKHVITFKFTVKVTEGGVDTVKVVTKKVNVIVPGTKA